MTRAGPSRGCSPESGGDCTSRDNGPGPVLRCWPAGSPGAASSPGGVAVAEARLRRDSMTRRLAHEPLGWRPTTLLITIRRYRCTGWPHVWRQDTSRAADPRAKLSRHALRWALEGIVCQHLTVARVAEGPRRVAEHRERCCGGRGQACVDRGATPVEGRSKQVFKTWLGERDTSWRDGVEVVAKDGFTGFKNATSEELPARSR
jgi:hypothetical protein